MPTLRYLRGAPNANGQHTMPHVRDVRRHSEQQEGDRGRAELVLEPAGMSRSTFVQPLPADLRDKAATGYRAAGDPVGGRSHTYPEQAAAGLWTTPEDLAPFAIALQQAAAGTSTRPLLPREMATRMLQPVMDEYGLGVSVAGSGRETLFSHTGGNAGFRCQLVAFKDNASGVVVMTNGDRGTTNRPRDHPRCRTGVSLARAESRRTDARHLGSGGLQGFRRTLRDTDTFAARRSCHRNGRRQVVPGDQRDARRAAARNTHDVFRDRQRPSDRVSARPVREGDGSPRLAGEHRAGSRAAVTAAARRVRSAPRSRQQLSDPSAVAKFAVTAALDTVSTVDALALCSQFYG